MLVRRLLLVLAVLLGLTALAGGVAPRDRPAGVDAGATPPAGLREPPQPVEKTLDASGAGQRVVARVGQTVTITVESDVLDSVSIAEMGSKTVEPESPARFELLADVAGSYAIELLESERQIGTLEIREPAG
jgi:hypothetical protein